MDVLSPCGDRGSQSSSSVGWSTGKPDLNSFPVCGGPSLAMENISQSTEVQAVGGASGLQKVGGLSQPQHRSAESPCSWGSVQRLPMNLLFSF